MTLSLSPFHFGEMAVNLLTNDALDPVARIPELKVCAVKISMRESHWQSQYKLSVAGLKQFPHGNLFQRIKRAFDSLSSLAQHMGVDHGCRDIIMPQKALDCPDISACLQKVCRERMTIMRS